MKILVRSLRLIAAGGLLAAVAACGGSKTNSTSVSLTGIVTGLTDNGLVLTNGVSSVAVAANATSFVFPSRILIGSTYMVQPSALPATLTCTVAGGTGTASSSEDITSVKVTCVKRNNLGGSISGLAYAGLILANGSDVVRPAAGALSFVFPTKVGQGFSYGVTVLQQPAPQSCVVANATGIMGAADVTNVQVSCQ